jgi:TPR repeat protein
MVDLLWVFLGIQYFNGEGVRQDRSKALSLYGKDCDLKKLEGCERYAKLKYIGVK